MSEDWTKPPPLHPTTRVPKIFNVWGTLIYGGAAITSIIAVLSSGFFKWTPPWYISSAALLYVFISTGIVCLGRIESNRDAKVYLQSLRKLSDENKRRLN